MYIKKLHIAAFGTLINRDFSFARGLNIIEGPNESGKTAAAMFIKFIFYGLSGAKGNPLTERQKYINWKTGNASGYAVCELEDGREVRIERILSVTETADGKSQYRESVKLIDNATNMPLTCPPSVGEHFLGVPESVFVNTAFVRQQFGVKPDSAVVSQSVENIICSADENISVKKALDEIDKARIRLLYKNKNGGLIFDLANKRDGLLSSMEEDRETSVEAIKTEAALTELQPMKEAALKRKEQLDELFEALEVIIAKRKLDAAEKIKADIVKMEAELEVQKDSGIDDGFALSLDSCERDIERYKSMSAESSKTDYTDYEAEEYPDDDDDNFEPTPFEDIAKAEKLHSKSKISFAISMILMLAGLFGVFATFVFYYLKIGDYFISAISTAAVLAVGIIFFAINGKQRGEVAAILDDWGASSLDTLEDSVKQALESREKFNELKKERETADADLRAAYMTAESSRKELKNLAYRAGLGNDTVENAQDGELIDALKKICADQKDRIGKLEAGIANLRGRLSAIEEQTADYNAEEIKANAAQVMSTQAGKHAASMNQESIKEAARERGFCANRYAGLIKRENELDCKLAALRASAKSPANTAERISQIDSQIEKLNICHDAYMMAYENLSKASENMRSGIIPRVTSLASSMMEEISNGKYSGLGVSPKFEMHFSSADAGTKEIEYLSSGTGDIAYVSLRLALIHSLFEDRIKPPAVFDESFSRLDEMRLDAALHMLSSESFGMQSIVCTCRALEGNLAEKYSAHYISLAKAKQTE